MTQVPSSKLVVVFGGSGFVGRHVVRTLAKRGHRIRVACRRPDLAGHLQPLGGVGQIQCVQSNLRYPESVSNAAHGADVIVNLGGILAEWGQQSFDAVQADGARSVAKAAQMTGANLVHMSAIGADENSEAGYARSKALGEEWVREEMPNATILRPSIIFGPEDDFFNRFAAMAKMAPVLPLIGGGHTRFQPIYVGDVAQAVTKAVDGEIEAGKIWEIGGPEVLSFKECLEKMLLVTNRSRPLVSLPFGIAHFIGSCAQYLPGAPLTPGQVELLKTDNVVSEQSESDGFTLRGMGIAPTSVSSILPSYLVRFRKHGQFEANRGL